MASRVTFNTKPVSTEIKPVASAAAPSQVEFRKKNEKEIREEERPLLVDKQVDLLSLKQQVVEEIKNELHLVG